jgi:glutaminyl-tRNA synthetase
LILDNYPKGKVEEFDVPNNPEDPQTGTRKVPFTRELWIEAEDFMANPPKNFYRLSPGKEVRLRGAYFVKAVSFSSDSNGNVTEIHAEYDPATRGGDSPDKRKVKATLHWLSAEYAVQAEARLYDRLFTEPDPNHAPAGKTYMDFLNPNSLEILSHIWVENVLSNAPAGSHWQFERIGYFCADKDSSPEHIIFNRAVTLKDAFAKGK